MKGGDVFMSEEKRMMYLKWGDTKNDCQLTRAGMFVAIIYKENDIVLLSSSLFIQQ